MGLITIARPLGAPVDVATTAQVVAACRGFDDPEAVDAVTVMLGRRLMDYLADRGQMDLWPGWDGVRAAMADPALDDQWDLL